jgi:uncharacterized membrane protein
MSMSCAKPLWRSLWPALAVMVSMQAAATTYNITTLPGTTVDVVTQVFGINNAGQVAGAYLDNSGQRAFVYNAGSVTPLSGPAGALGATALGISDGGAVVGSYYNTQVIDPVTGNLVLGPSQGFLFNGTSYQTINFPGAESTLLRSVSPNGRYVSGYATDPTGLISGFVLDRNTSSFTNVGRANSQFTLAQGVNNAGVVVGSDVLAQAGAPALRVGFIYDLASGTRTDYSFAGYSRTAFRDIDASGRLVGWLNGTGAGGQPLTISFAGTPSNYELFAIAGSSNTTLQSLNDAGTLAGNYFDAAGLGFSFIATPVPEPQTAVLMLAALGCLAWQRRRVFRG